MNRTKTLRTVGLGIAALCLLVTVAAAQPAEGDAGPPDFIVAMLEAEDVHDAGQVARLLGRVEEIEAESGRHVKARHRPEKRAKRLFRFLHDDVLLRYDESATLSQTLTAGRFNCVTATALYQRLADVAVTRRPLPRTRLGKLRRHQLEERVALHAVGEPRGEAILDQGAGGRGARRRPARTAR